MMMDPNYDYRRGPGPGPNDEPDWKRQNTQWGEHPPMEDQTHFNNALADEQARAGMRNFPPNMPNPANKRQREIFIGNMLPGTTTDADLRGFFLNLFGQLPEFNEKYGGQDPVREIRLGPECKYAFVEFHDEVLTNTAMKFDRAALQGRELNIGRPKDYAAPPPNTMLPSLNIDCLKGVVIPSAKAPTGEKIKRELYIGSIPEGCGKEQLQAAYAKVMDLHCSPDEVPSIIDYRIGKTGSFGFLEFRTEELATKGLEVLAEVPVGGRELKISRPSAYGKPAGSSSKSTDPAMDALTNQYMNMQVQYMQMLLHQQGMTPQPTAPAPAAPAPVPVPPTAAAPVKTPTADGMNTVAALTTLANSGGQQSGQGYLGQGYH